MPRQIFMKKIFLTGATGFVGKHLLPRLAESDRVICLSRKPPQLGEFKQKNIEWVAGDLGDPAELPSQLKGVDVVVHLAALTGKAKPEQYIHVNVAGTRALLEAAQAVGVARFLHVSSVAVKFPDKTGYPYGQSKETAETFVRDSSVRHVIVRPAIVLGAGSPAWKGMGPMLGLPVMPVFGDGRTPIQPIHVDDLAEFLCEIIRRDLFDGSTLEFGGPEVLSFEELMQRAREKRTRRRARVVHIPLGPVVALLSAMEPIFSSMLPVTAGQLSSFRYSGVMEANPLWEERKARLRPVREMLE